METRLALKYAGPAVDAGQMDVYEAAANMIAFSDFVVLAAKVAFGDSITARAEVAGFGRGSFITDLVFNVSGATASVFQAATPQQILDLIKSAIDLWKHLKGEPPKSVEQQGNTVNVVNNNGQVLQVNLQTLNVVFSNKGVESVSQFVRQALEKPGVESVEIAGEQGTIDRVTQSESHNFKNVTPSEKTAEALIRMGLILEAPMFRDDLMWRVSDGSQAFYATVEDQDFLARVNAGERFGKGDVLYADVRYSQQLIAGKLSVDRVIVKVHEHKAAPQQLPLK